MNPAKPLQENLVSLVAIYGKCATEKETSAVDIDGVGTKDLNRYDLDYLIFYSYLPWFWKEHEAVNVKV